MNESNMQSAAEPQASPDLDALISRVIQLPSLPVTALALLRLGDASEASLAVLTRVVHDDPAVTVRVLRVANSAFFGVPGGVLTVQDALVVLGSSTLRALALTAALAPALPAPPQAAFRPAPFWRSALACAVLTASFADNARVASDIAFTAGLLHNIGVLAWCSVAPASFAQHSAQALEQQVSLHTLCRQSFGWDGFVLGERLAQRWGLPATLSEVIGGLGQPQCNDHRHPQGSLLSVLRVAMAFAEQLSASGVTVPARLAEPGANAPAPAAPAAPGAAADAEPARQSDPDAVALDDHLLHEWIDRACPQGSAAQMALQSLALSPSRLLRHLRRAAEAAGTVDNLVD